MIVINVRKLHGINLSVYYLNILSCGTTENQCTGIADGIKCDFYNGCACGYKWTKSSNILKTETSMDGNGGNGTYCLII